MAKKEKEKREKNVKGSDKIREKYKPKSFEMMSTDIIPLDLVLGGGIPKGSFIELASPSGLGKSSLMAHASRNILAQGFKVHWWDFEHGLTEGLKDSMGLSKYEDSKLFEHFDPVTYGDGEEILEGLSPEDLPDMICVDSESSMMPDKMLAGSILDGDIGLKSRLSSNFLLKYKGWCRQRGISVVFINQMRVRMTGPSFALKAVEDSAGGNALKFYSDIRLRMKKSMDIKKVERTLEGEKEVVYGVEVYIWAIKNREIRSHIQLPCPIIFGRGVSMIQVLKRVLLGAGLVESRGSYFKIKIPEVMEETVQGDVNLFKKINENKVNILNYVKDNQILFLVRG